MKFNKDSGITLIVLIITIVVLLIIAGITIFNGKDIIRRGKLEELRTNMLLIEAKAKEYVEEANFKMGISPDEVKKEEVRNEIYVEKAKLQKASEAGIDVPSAIPLQDCYNITQDAFKEWGLDKIEVEDNEYYLIKFDDQNATVEIYNTLGYNDEGTVKYSLTDIDKIEE